MLKYIPFQSSRSFENHGEVRRLVYFWLEFSIVLAKGKFSYLAMGQKEGKRWEREKKGGGRGADLESEKKNFFLKFRCCHITHLVKLYMSCDFHLSRCHSLGRVTL